MAPKKRRKHSNRHTNDHLNFQDEIEALFSKKFTLKSSGETWAELPDACCMFQEPAFVLQDMIFMKDELNRKKSLLNDMDIVEWHSHTRRAHKAGLVVKHLRDKLHVEMCTQAWAKFHEILHSFDLVPEDAKQIGKIRTVHLCEAPGAFVACLNHLLKSNYRGLDWDWMANTLNPYYEGHDLEAMLDDDRFISETLSHWHFGADGTGDLMNLTNVEALQHDMPSVHMVTADGSINCANQPEEQEGLVAQLIFCEAVTAINLLSKRGNFVFKMFTSFEHQMICLLYLLTCLFQEIEVIKPGTSKSGNSEIYVVCLDFIGREEIPAEVMAKLSTEYGPCSPSLSLFPLSSVPPMFWERLKVCEKYFTGLQMEAIDQHIRQFHYMSAAERKAHVHLRQLIVRSFVERFPLQPIRREDRMVPSTILDGTQLSVTRGPTNGVPFCENFNGRNQMGSFNQRQLNLHQDWLQKIQADELFQFSLTQSMSLQGISQASSGDLLIPLYCNQVVWLSRLPYATSEDITKSWKPQTAARLEVVLNSRFCTPLYVSKLIEAQQQATILKKDNSDNLKEILDKISPANIVNMFTGGEAELRNLDSLVNFTDLAKNGNFGILLNTSSDLHHLPKFLLEREAQFSSVHVSVSAPSGKPLVAINKDSTCQVKDISQAVKRLCHITDKQRINLVFADVNNSDELSSGRDILSLCVIALQLLETGGMFLCHICETLTRFSAGILYVLHLIFEELTIVKPVMSRLSNPMRFLVCKGFHSSGHCGVYLEKVLGLLSKLDHEKSPMDVVEIVPMNDLYSVQFYSFVKRINEQLAHLQLQSIVQLENIFLYPEKMPSDEEITKLREAIIAYLK